VESTQLWFKIDILGEGSGHHEYAHAESNSVVPSTDWVCLDIPNEWLHVSGTPSSPHLDHSCLCNTMAAAPLDMMFKDEVPIADP
jgi:hypothetical protein